MYIADLGCIATSYGPTKRCLMIDLMAEGVTEYIMDECKLPIYICEWLVSCFVTTWLSL